MNDAIASLTRRVLPRPSSPTGSRQRPRRPTEMTLLARAGDPATAAGDTPRHRAPGLHTWRGCPGSGDEAARAAAHALPACNVYLRYLQIAVVEGGPRLGDPEAGTVASLTSTRFSIASGGLAVRLPRHDL